MSSNITQFLSRLKGQEKFLNEEVQKVEKDVVSEVFNALLEDKGVGGTPRQTGWLAANWIISLDNQQPFPVGSKTNVASAKGAQKSSFSQFMRSNLLNTDIIYINNGVPYGPAVNYGSPTQTPQHFRERSIKRGTKRLNKDRVIK